MDYFKVEDYDCPSCSWSLHVDRGVWEKFPHQPILDYIQSKVQEHTKQEHSFGLFASSEDLEKYISSPYIKWPQNPGEEKE
jgi:hypothetical protein